MTFRINPKKLSRHVKCVITQGEEHLDLDARLPLGDVGYIWGSISKHRLEIDDFKVYDDVNVRYPFANSLFVIIFGSLPQANFRGLGIGSRLLTEFIAEARKLGIREIWGSVTEDYVMQTPHLLDFYRKHGFSINEPDDECMDIAKWKIVMRLV